MKELEYPFDGEEIIKKKKKYRRLLLEDESRTFIDKKIAILGGQTTEAIKQVLELFLLNQGIRPSFYESEYNMWYEDGMFDNAKLLEFAPDVIYICTCIRNLTQFPHPADSFDVINQKKDAEVSKFVGLWDHLTETYHATIIQNDFEYPFYRMM
jgi:predicted enzyme involved in methoxymalonyl-ACP biosynthesis